MLNTLLTITYVYPLSFSLSLSLSLFVCALNSSNPSDNTCMHVYYWQLRDDEIERFQEAELDENLKERRLSYFTNLRAFILLLANEEQRCEDFFEQRVVALHSQPLFATLLTRGMYVYIYI